MRHPRQGLPPADPMSAPRHANQQAEVAPTALEASLHLHAAPWHRVREPPLLHLREQSLHSQRRRRYRERDRRGLRRFYDNDVLGVAIQAVPNATHRDLCAGFLKPYKTPLPHTVLGKYLIHFKAKHSKAEYGQEPTDEDQ